MFSHISAPASAPSSKHFSGSPASVLTSVLRSLYSGLGSGFGFKSETKAASDMPGSGLSFGDIDLASSPNFGIAKDRLDIV